MRARNHWNAFTALVLLLGGIWIALTAWMSPQGGGSVPPAPRQGFSAPDFELRTLSGEPIRLSDLVGKPVIINFWATWCAPCQVEMPAFEAAHQKYNQDLIILAVNSTIQDDASQVEDFVRARDLTFPILLDPNGTATRAYQVRALPTTIMVNRNGMITNVVMGGPLSEAFLLSQIENLLQGAP